MSRLLLSELTFCIPLAFKSRYRIDFLLSGLEIIQNQAPIEQQRSRSSPFNTDIMHTSSVLA